MRRRGRAAARLSRVEPLYVSIVCSTDQGATLAKAPHRPRRHTDHGATLTMAPR